MERDQGGGGDQGGQHALVEQGACGLLAFSLPNVHQRRTLADILEHELKRSVSASLPRGDSSLNGGDEVGYTLGWYHGVGDEGGVRGEVGGFGVEGGEASDESSESRGAGRGDPQR